MRNRISLLLIFMVIITSSIDISITVETVKASGNILYVGGSGPGNYTAIQYAINVANSGDTVFVYKGKYYENVIINKTILLKGEDKKSTIIDGGNKTDTINITAEKVIISGFTITNASNHKWFNAGIRLTGSNNIINGNNIINNNKLGVFGKRVTNITISENDFINNSITFSLYDDESEDLTYIEKYFIHNIYNNTANGKNIYYFYNKNFKNFNITKNIAAEVIAVSCTNLTITNANLTNVDFPIILINCSNFIIENSNLSNNNGIIWLIHSTKNIIQYNKISNNFEGICIDIESTRNIIKYNNITNNQYCGIIIESKSNYNKVIRNNFIKNYPKNPRFGQASFIYCNKNIWRNNYWNKPRVLPKLIIGNVSKLLPAINIDWHPALKPFDI